MDATRTREILGRVRRLEIRTRRLVEETMAGQYHSVWKGRGMDFEEVREYFPGDEVRSIDWNVTARTGRPFVKKFREERELTLLLLVDLSASGSFGSRERSKRELAAELACVLAFSAIRNQDRVGLVLFTDRVEKFIPPAKGRSHVLRVVREILYFEPEHRGTDLRAALDFASRVVPRRAISFLISDFVVPGCERGLPEDVSKALALTNRRHDLVAIVPIDPRERTLPQIGIVTLEDAETGEQIEVDTHDRALRERYEAAASAHVDSLRRSLRGAGVDLLEVPTEEPYLPALQRFFRGRSRRAA
ncbi:hypothetical protein MYXO_01846 [Myxococcaceae bacterium]|nr:hypothetical protein MYXO_01846 [Myxococcaceae bacterium]